MAPGDSYRADLAQAAGVVRTCYGPMAGISDEQFRKILDNNILANHWLIQMAAPGMLERKDGSVIIVSSIGGLKGSPVIGAYNVSKAADIQLARNLAVEWGRYSIRVNGIAPGPIEDTEGMQRLVPEPVKERLRKTIPLGRFGRIADIEKAAVFICSDAASYINGTVLVVDGGQWLASNRMVGG